MTEALAIPNALDVLRTQLAGTTEAANLLLPLRALQMRGLTRMELVVHVERLRARNDVVADDEQFEENCLVALDIIHGKGSRHVLTWDAAHQLAALLPRCLTRNDLAQAVPFAMTASDLLPPRPELPQSARVANVFARVIDASIQQFRPAAARAEFIRAPKTTFTTRPAAVMAFPDRVAYEALVAPVEAALAEQLPPEVVWPRSRSARDPSSFPSEVVAWGSQYVVKADVAHFYESIEHSLLSVFVSNQFGISVVTARAIEAALTSAMGMERGLPQGPLASDVLASAYVYPIDRELTGRGIHYIRYADDYFFPAESVGEGRALLQELEALLRDIGLSLSDKSQVMRHSTYSEGLDRAGVRAFKEEAMQTYLAEVEDLEDADEATALWDASGLPEQTMWDLLYHRSVTIEEVVGDALADSSLQEAYAIYFEALSVKLRSGDIGDLRSPMASLALECLTILAPSDVELDHGDLLEVQTWFSHLTPAVVGYLISGQRDTSAGEYIKQRLADPSGLEWVDAWMSHAAAHLPRDRMPVVELEHLAVSDAAAPLVRVEAVRALAAAGEVTQTEWRRAFQSVAPALRSEMLFAGLGQRAEVPWLAAIARDAGYKDVADIVGLLDAGAD